MHQGVQRSPFQQENLMMKVKATGDNKQVKVH